MLEDSATTRCLGRPSCLRRPYIEAPTIWSCPNQPARRGVSTQAPNGASRVVGTHHGPTRIHLADYSLRNRRDGNAVHYDTLSSPQPPLPAPFLRDDCGPTGLMGMGTAAASAGAGGPSKGLRAGWSSGRTEAGVHRPSGAGRRPGLGARLLATSDEARAGWY